MKSRLKLFISMMLLVVSFGAINVYAMDNGVYLVSTTTSYSNPTTGKITDGGSSNSALGESMCRSVIGSQALLEVENGSYYITVRVNLMSNISNISLKEQTSGNNYSAVSTTLMQQSKGADTADYRFKVSDPSKYISASMYIGPMGRDVNFYFWINESSAKAGKGDFVQTIKLQGAEPVTNTNTSSSSQASSATTSSSSSVSSSSGTLQAASGNTSSQTSNSSASTNQTQNTASSSQAPSATSSSSSATSKVEVAQKTEAVTPAAEKKTQAQAAVEKADEKVTEKESKDALEVDSLENADEIIDIVALETTEETELEAEEVVEESTKELSETSSETVADASEEEAAILEEVNNEVNEEKESTSVGTIVASIIIGLMVAAIGAGVYWKKMRK